MIDLSIIITIFIIQLFSFSGLYLSVSCQLENIVCLS